MILPSVMPDEFARSLLSRMCVLNGVDSPDALMPDLASLFGPSSRAGHKPTWSDLLASANRITPQAFHARHTLLPFRRAIRPVADCTPFGSVRDLLETTAHRTCLDRQPLRLCPECATEDTRFWGFSYWRRSHQLYGTALCQKHQVGLHEAKASSWRTLPHDAISASTAIDVAITREAKRNPVIQRYAEISAGLAERTQPVSTAWMVQVLKQRIQSHHAASGRRARRLTDIAADMIHGPWQKRFFPELDLVGGQQNGLDRTCSSVRLGYSTQFYALALAVLFDCPDNAMNEVNSTVMDSFTTQSIPMSKGQKNRPTGLPAAAQSFFGGATITDAARSHGIEASQLEELLRMAAAHLTRMMVLR
jgi:hypothetical protein